MNCPPLFVHWSERLADSMAVKMSGKGGFDLALFQALRAAFLPTFRGY